MLTYKEFLGKKTREGRKQLRIISRVLEHGGFKVKEFLQDNLIDPYIFCYNPDHNTSFKGIRIYKIGDSIAYRIQRESKTHPFGAAYLLDLDDIFNDLTGSGMTEDKKLGKKIMHEIIDSIKLFFKESARIEKKEDDWDDEESMGSVHVRNPLGGDYSSMVTDPNFGSSSGR